MVKNYSTPQHIPFIPEKALRKKRSWTQAKSDSLGCANPQTRKKSGAAPLHYGKLFCA